jgi:hypothetical protein
MVGIVIGYLAVQTGSLLPSIAFHLVYNSLGLIIGLRLAPAIAEHSWLQWLFVLQGDNITYRWPVLMAGGLLSFLILRWFQRLPYARTAEEELQEALQRQSAHAAAS